MPRLAVSGIVLAVLLVGACRSSDSSRDDQAAPRTPVRVLSYNIHHGEGQDGRLDLRRIADVILRAKPDLVALQEVDQRTTRVNGADQAGELAWMTGYHVVFGRAIHYAGGEYGEAVLSRYPPNVVRNHALPAAPDHEARAALEVIVEIPGRGELRFVGTHLDHTDDPADRIQQAQTIAGLFADEIPTILAGDLNATAEQASMGVLLAEWEDAAAGNPAATFPSHAPERRIDYVLFRPRSAFRVLETRVIEEPVASDHAPLLAVLE